MDPGVLAPGVLDPDLLVPGVLNPELLYPEDWAELDPCLSGEGVFERTVGSWLAGRTLAGRFGPPPGNVRPVVRGSH